MLTALTPNTMCDIITSCNELLYIDVYLSYKCQLGQTPNLSFSVSVIYSLSKDFMDMVSRLVTGTCSILNKLSNSSSEGITSLIANSEALMMLIVFQDATVLLH